jgi:Protein of unknown function (DUF3567)
MDAMDMLYNSDSFSVMHLHTLQAVDPVRPDVPALQREGFEIVDKRSGKEIYLEGHWAELFQEHLKAWQENSPSQEEVEDTLAGYAELAQTPMMVH